jgi:hypothetical protein
LSRRHSRLFSGCSASTGSDEAAAKPQRSRARTGRCGPCRALEVEHNGERLACCERLPCVGAHGREQAGADVNEDAVGCQYRRSEVDHRDLPVPHPLGYLLHESHCAAIGIPRSSKLS